MQTPAHRDVDVVCIVNPRRIIRIYLLAAARCFQHCVALAQYGAVSKKVGPPLKDRQYQALGAMGTAGAGYASQVFAAAETSSCASAMRRRA